MTSAHPGRRAQAQRERGVWGYWSLCTLLSRMSGDWCGSYPQLVSRKVTGSCAWGMPLYTCLGRNLGDIRLLPRWCPAYRCPVPTELDLRQGADLRGSDSVAMAGRVYVPF